MQKYTYNMNITFRSHIIMCWSSHISNSSKELVDTEMPLTFWSGTAYTLTYIALYLLWVLDPGYGKL